MPRGDLKKIVSKAAASGGSRSYKEARPWGYYTLLAVIAILGVAGIYYSRYEMQHPPKPIPAAAPAVGTTWYEAIGFEICGSFKPNLPQNPNLSSVGLFTTGNGVITISPKNSSEAGANATLAKFISEYPNLVINANEIKLPKGPAYKVGDKCPGQSQKSVIKIAEYSSITSLQYKLDPLNTSKIKLANNHSLTIYYGPENGKIMPPLSRPLLPQLSKPPAVPSSSLGQSPYPTITLPSKPTTK